jgi:hypothetical protein
MSDRRIVGAALMLLGLCTVLSLDAAADATINIKITQRYLVARCFDGRAVDAETRAWKVEPGPVTLAFTMRSQPHQGGETPNSGTAAVSFTAEAGHRYEVETRADAASYSRRVWRKEEWIPVVRDRTTDRIVSDAARWVDAGCATP